MYKRFLIMLTAILITIATILTSCFIVNTDDDELPAPQVISGNTYYSLSAPWISNMKYANIIRQSSTSDSFDKELNTQNIGQIIPTENITSFVFTDEYTAKQTANQTDGNSDLYYRYAIRYYDGNSYTTTAFSKPKDGTSKGLSEEAKLSVDSDSEVTIDYASASYSFTLKKTVKVSHDKFEKLAIVVSNGSISRAFTFDTVTSDSTTFPADTTTLLDFRARLSADFFDTDLTTEGLIAFIETEESAGHYKKFYWTSRLPVTLTIDGNSSDKPLKIASENKSGDDFLNNGDELKTVYHRSVLDIN